MIGYFEPLIWTSHTTHVDPDNSIPKDELHDAVQEKIREAELILYKFDKSRRLIDNTYYKELVSKSESLSSVFGTGFLIGALVTLALSYILQ